MGFVLCLASSSSALVIPPDIGLYHAVVVAAEDLVLALPDDEDQLPAARPRRYKGLLGPGYQY